MLIMKARKEKIKNRFFADDSIPKEKLQNVGTELLRYIKGHRVICADILIEGYLANDQDFRIILKKGHTKKQFQHFLNVLKCCWYCGGLYGKVWCNGGVWIERVEDEYSEWWCKRQYPRIPPELC